MLAALQAYLDSDGPDTRDAVTAFLRGRFGERDADGIEVDYSPEARQVLVVLCPTTVAATLYGKRLSGYPSELEKAVSRALTTSTQENGYTVEEPAVEAESLMDHDADVERLVREAKPTPSIPMVAAMVVKWLNAQPAAQG